MTTASDTALIFVSHASEDAEATRLLQQDLDDRFLGAVRFFNTSSRDSLKAGEKWLDTIMASLKSSRIILPILSPAALRSPWVNFETGGAWLNGATVIPCCGGQVRKDSLPAPYSWLQAINLDDAQDLELLVTRIAEEVKLRSRTDGLTDLAERMSVVFALGSTESVDGFGTKLGNRIDELLEIEWRYRRAEHDPTRWAATQQSRRKFKVTDPAMESLPISYVPAVEAVLFSTEHAPRLRLDNWERSSAGSIRIAEPHARRGNRFAFRIYFEPALKPGDTADFAYTVDFPEYRLGVREDYVMAQLDSGRAEISDFQQNSRDINRPTERFVYRVIIPKSLGASPIDPSVTRYSHAFLDEENFVRSNDEVYSVRVEDIDGEECWVLELHRDNPPYQASYKLRWRLPSRRDLGTA
jgi:hypothetical protein